MLEIPEWSHIGISVHFQVVKRTISWSHSENLAQEKVFKSCRYDLNLFPNKLLVFFAISHTACQPYEGRIYFLFQAELWNRWASCHHRTWLCLQVMWGRGRGEAEAMVVTSRNVLMVAWIQAWVYIPAWLWSLDSGLFGSSATLSYCCVGWRPARLRGNSMWGLVLESSDRVTQFSFQAAALRDSQI